MLSTRWRKVLRDLWHNKTRTLLVALSIAVGLFAFGAIQSTQAVLTREATRLYVSTNPAHATLSANFGEDFVRAVRLMPEIKQAEGRRLFSVRLRQESRRRNLRLLALPNFDTIAINKIERKQGAWPPAKRELVLEQSALSALGVRVGDMLTIELPDGATRLMRLAGTAYDIQSPPPGFGNFFNAYVTFDTMEWLGQPRTYNRLLITLAEQPLDRLKIQAVAERIQQRLEREGKTVGSISIPNPGKHPADNAIQSILLVLGVLGGLSLFASAFLIVNTVSALLAQQIRQIGVMKAVGARTKQIAGMYLGMVLIFGMLSLAIALPLGSAGAFGLTRFAAHLMNFEGVNYAPPFRVYGVQIAVALIVPVLAAAWPVIRGARITVREAISSYGLEGDSFGTSVIDRIVERVRGLSRPLLLSLRNTFRRKTRLALTLGTLTLSGAIFISVYSVRDSLQRTLADAARYWNYNVTVSFPRFYPVGRLANEAMNVPGVIDAESWGFDSASRVVEDAEGKRVESRSFTIIAPSAGTQLLRPDVLQGRWLRPEDIDAIVVNTEWLEDHPDVRVGSTIQIKMRGRIRTWEVVGIVRAVLTGRTAYVNYPHYSSIVNQPGRASSVFVMTRTNNADDETRLAQELEDHFAARGMRPASVNTASADRANIEYQFGLLVTFLLIMALLLAIVGGLGLSGTMSMNVLERTREIGVMRAIGASTGAIVRIVIFEGVFIGLLSWVQGALLAWPISRLMSDAIGELIVRSPLSFVFSAPGVLIWLAVVVVVSAAASVAPALNASRISVREALAYE
ncbi:MAG: ABC transporter permease [Anaerolineae bacterium]|nr:ABC transporter permease [Thermoflexales bacterium]MDW8408376.1 ABC transporter permease [Anaerolineae bacterium]